MERVGDGGGECFGEEPPSLSLEDVATGVGGRATPSLSSSSSLSILIGNASFFVIVVVVVVDVVSVPSKVEEEEEKFLEVSSE